LLLFALPVGAARPQTRAESTASSFFNEMQEIGAIDELSLSPDGDWAAYVTAGHFGPAASGSSYITVLDLAHHRTRRVAFAGQPFGLRWAGRDGVQEVLAFMAAADGRNRVWQYSPFGSDSIPRPIAIPDSLGGEILSFAWSPSGTAIAYLAAEERRPGYAEQESKTAAPRVVLFNVSPGEYTGPTSHSYSRDSAGAYVAVKELGRGVARVLARHVVSAENSPTVEWSRSGMLLVNGAAMRVSWLAELTSGLLYSIDPSSGARRPTKLGFRSAKRAVWSPDGQHIASLRLDFLPEGKLPLSRYTLQVGSPVGSGADISFDAETDGLAYSLPPFWGGNDRTIYIARYQNATARLFVVDLTSERWRPITPDTLSITRYAVSRDGRTVLGVLENANQPQEIFQIDPVTSALTRLTRNAEQLPRMHLGHVDQVAWKSSDRRFTIHGFLVKPPNVDPTKRYPLVVLIHGGPGALFTNDFVGINFAPSLPPQLLAAAGYMVLLPNPRGDPSYGEEFQNSLHTDLAPGPFADVEAGVDALIALGLVDSTALGIAGASYGGYLTAYAITQTHRFAAASINDGKVDLRSEYGQNYATRSSWAKAIFDGPPWTKPALYASQSPITYISRVRTPVIMRYGGKSNTGDSIRQSYMLAQGFELYAALKDVAVPVEFVLHPDQGHGITDWGLYKDWVIRNLAWFNYWLLGDGPCPAGPERSACVLPRGQER
jgi:dipeptidyl aminopeptidase/acylaminoacyl peptidase